MATNDIHLIWDILVAFFKAKKSFTDQRVNYERMVLEYSNKMSVDRSELHLGTREVAGLLDFKAIEELRNNYLRELKSLAHSMFRKDDSTDIFDKYVSDIYHEVSILKEEHYTVMTYAPAYEEGLQLDLTERDKILAEVHDFFPRKVEQIRNLFEKAQSRLEEMLPQYTQNRILVRSLYLFGQEILQKAGEPGIEELYRKMYPAEGALQGYLEAARSFHESAFYELADKALKQARAALRKSSLTEEKKKEKREEVKQLAKLTSTALARLSVSVASESGDEE